MADTGTKYTPVNRLAQVKSSKYTPVNRLANLPPKPLTTTQKVVSVGKELVKGFVKPVATMVARPIQLGAELLGASDESVNQFTKDKFGDWIAPTPQNAGDVYKDVGRGIQTALTIGIGETAIGALKGAALKPVIGKLAAEGAGFGLGASMEQGDKILSKETAKNVALGAGLNIAVPFALKGIGRVLKGKGGKVAETVAGGVDNLATKVDDVTGKVASKVDDVIPTKLPPDVPSTIKSNIPTKKSIKIDEAVKLLDQTAAPISLDLPLEQQAKLREFAHTNNVAQVEAVTQHDLPYIIKAATGEIVPTDAPATAYMAHLKIVAKELADQGDTSLALELSKHPNVNLAKSIAGQDLQAVQIASKNNIVDQLADIAAQKEKKLPKNIIKNKDARINNIKKSIEDTVERLQKNPVERSFVSDLLDKITCK